MLTFYLPFSQIPLSSILYRRTAGVHLQGLHPKKTVWFKGESAANRQRCSWAPKLPPSSLNCTTERVWKLTVIIIIRTSARVIQVVHRRAVTRQSFLKVTKTTVRSDWAQGYKTHPLKPAFVWAALQPHALCQLNPLPKTLLPFQKLAPKTCCISFIKFFF